MPAETAAVVDLTVPNNVTWQDAFQFGDTDDLTWNLTGQNFIVEVKASYNDSVPIYTLTSSGGTIVVDDVTQRVLHFNVSEALIRANLPVAEYVYDLVMFDGSVPPVRVMLMSGAVEVTQGVTGN